MTNKLTILIVSCILISFGGTFLVQKGNKDVYKQVVIYGVHDVESDINLTILFNQYQKTRFDSEALQNQVKIFVNKLNFNVSGGKSSCSSLPVVTKVIPVLIYYDPSRIIKVELIGDDRELMNECALFVTKLVSNFNEKKRNYYLALMETLELTKGKSSADIDYGKLDLEKKLNQLGFKGYLNLGNSEDQFGMSDKTKAEVMGHFIESFISSYEKNNRSTTLPYSGIDKDKMAGLELLKLEYDRTFPIKKISSIIIFFSIFLSFILVMYVYYYMRIKKNFRTTMNKLNKLIS